MPLDGPGRRVSIGWVPDDFVMCHRCSSAQAQQFNCSLARIQETRIDRSRGRNFLDDRSELLVLAGYVSYVGFERELHAVGRDSLTFHIVQGLFAHALDHLAHAALSFRAGERNAEAMFVDVGDIRDGRAERAEDSSQVEDVCLGDADALRHAAGKSRAIAAKGEERAFLWPPVNTAEDISQRIRHPLERGPGNIQRWLSEPIAAWTCDVLFDDFARPFCVELA